MFSSSSLDRFALWITYGLGALAGIVCLGVIIRSIFVPSDIRRSCCCGGCGYPLSDRIPEQCPECGGRPVKLGVTTPAMAVRLRGGLTWALLAWTAGCGMIAQLAWGYVQQAAWEAAIAGSGPNGKLQHSWNSNFTPNTFGGPRGSGTEPADSLHFRVDADVSWVSNKGVTESGTAVYTLHNGDDPALATMELDLGAQSFQMKDVKGTVLVRGSVSDVDAGLVKKWFEAAQLGTEGPSVATALRDTKRLLSMTFADPEGVQNTFQGFGSGDRGALRSNGGGSSSGPVGSVGGMPMPEYWTLRTQLIAGVLGTFYVAGFVFICWRRRRLLT